ncbi:CRP-like cAMP-binding protein [Catalinimonas alkaloidigena]|uniref:Crp/Fnr family transcriptional regulator n=1 Tax=Catalinimonas alkaloidigena TaxID=1075417 RepID=UPI002405800C|nr:Crp/Fnr family transcriptional regulator [Catalinimonas alkaloidigena]MDF9798153.1 CRP-like cAMP-binding protein [Catalinimonas alkaloidigena]
MHTLMLQAIRAITNIPEDQETKLLSICKSQSVRKGDLFIREGQVPHKFAFVNAGLFRYFYVDEKGNEFTKGFFPEGLFLSSYSAMIQEIPSYFTIEALENAEILVIDYEAWNDIRAQHPCWNEFLLAMMEKAFIIKEMREREFLLFDAEKRYLLFLDRYPGLDQRIRQHLIASYLGITSVALSRIRRKMGVVNLG